MNLTVSLAYKLVLRWPEKDLEGISRGVCQRITLKLVGNRKENHGTFRLWFAQPGFNSSASQMQEPCCRLDVTAVITDCVDCQIFLKILSVERGWFVSSPVRQLQSA
jgi:hypothetical protein